jgi:hypothetical protein
MQFDVCIIPCGLSQTGLVTGGMESMTGGDEDQGVFALISQFRKTNLLDQSHELSEPIKSLPSSVTLGRGRSGPILSPEVELSSRKRSQH